MGKKLVGRHNIDQFICQEKQTLYLDHTLILSPGGKDYLQEKGIKVVYGERPSSPDNSVSSSGVLKKADSEVEEKVRTILKRDYEIKDESQLNTITETVLARLGELQ